MLTVHRVLREIADAGVKVNTVTNEVLDANTELSPILRLTDVTQQDWRRNYKPQLEKIVQAIIVKEMMKDRLGRVCFKSIQYNRHKTRKRQRTKAGQISAKDWDDVFDQIQDEGKQGNDLDWLEGSNVTHTEDDDDDGEEEGDDSDEEDDDDGEEEGDDNNEESDDDGEEAEAQFDKPAKNKSKASKKKKRDEKQGNDLD